MVPEIKHNEFIATRVIDQKIKETLESQSISLALPEKCDLASITSVVGRLPTFSYIAHNGIQYMRFQREVMFAKSSKGFVYILPTDDNRIKFVVTPYLGTS